jgi:dTDP-4-amino-4,6-dideoxygalactose transaminase
VDAIDAIAKKHNLKLIYDAAHAIGSTYKGKSVLEFGDISATSLHATKLLNTGEGGGCVTMDDELHEKLTRIRFFGHNELKDIVEDGFNGKMTEIHAALGLANLNYYDEVLADRKRKYAMYLEALQGVDGLEFQVCKIGEPNYSYFPVLFPSEDQLLHVEQHLNEHNIYPRRYFWPSVNTYDKIMKYQRVEISEDISNRVLCLPLYSGLTDDKQQRIIELIGGVS